MGGMVAALSEDDMKGLSTYFAGQQLKPESAKSKASIEYPRLSGQFADYTEAQLKAFRAGERANDPAKMMRTIALKMTDPEIKAVADFAAGLR